MSNPRRSRSISSTPPATPLQPNSLNDTTLNFNPRGIKQVLYRPAALRRNNSATWDLQLQVPSPPLSPSASSGDLRSSWLTNLAAAAPWSPLSLDKEPARTEAGPVRGNVMPLSQWVPDGDATTCAEPDCRISFGLVDRKHHCRSCGQIFCSTHSSRYTLLWTHNNESVPSTPIGTPRSSSLDIPSLAYGHIPTPLASPTSPASSIHSGSHRSSSPPRAPSQAVSCRVCDTCFFSPTSVVLPALQIPSYASVARNPAPVRPVNVRSVSSVNRSPLGSPGPSPPSEASTNYGGQSSSVGSSNGRAATAHHESMSVSTSPSSSSTAPTSLGSHGGKDGLLGVGGGKSSESILISDDEMDGKGDSKVVPATAFDTPYTPWAWNSWATF